MDSSFGLALGLVGLFYGLFSIAALIGWVLCGVGASWLAGQRGCNGTAWFFLGLATGPLAILVIGLATREPSGTFWRCPQCAEAITRMAFRCPHCATRFAAPDPQPGAYAGTYSGVQPPSW